MHKAMQKGPVGYISAIIPTENKFMNLNFDIDVKDAVSESIQDSVSDTNPDLNANICIPNTEQSDSIISPDVSSEIDPSLSNDLSFKSKGLHFCNLNIHHIVPKIDELRISMAHDKCPDIFGMCETYLTASISDDHIVIDDFDILRKDRSDTQNKEGGGVLFYTRKSINCRRRHEIETSNIETLWAVIT